MHHNSPTMTDTPLIGPQDLESREIHGAGNGGVPGTLPRENSPDSGVPLPDAQPHGPHLLPPGSILSDHGEVYMPPPRPTIVTRPKGKGPRRRSTDLMMKPGKRSWIWGTKLIFFEACQEQWVQASEQKTVGDFYLKMAQLYTAKYSFNLADDEDFEVGVADPPDWVANKVVNPFVDSIAERYGMCVSLLLCGPIGDRGGCIGMRSVHAGVTRELVEKDWPSHDPDGFSMVEACMVDFGHHVFTQAECDMRRTEVQVEEMLPAAGTARPAPVIPSPSAVPTTSPPRALPRGNNKNGNSPRSDGDAAAGSGADTNASGGVHGANGGGSEGDASGGGGGGEGGGEGGGSREEEMDGGEAVVVASKSPIHAQQ
ncbi:hypothetical protein B0H19DRAFT_1382625 [Mycena capillaripes]|nr:hypothetical protein B0H19DRAFT_1382625 [Mycena capillaripes]